MEKSFKTFAFKPNEVVASIGASGGVWEIYFASQVENLTFYLQDIDENLCNQEEIEAGITFYEKFLKRAISGKFFSVIGTEYQTKLPYHTFDKVLILNSFHEFSFPDAMLQDIANILKPQGILFIEEQLASYKGEIHEGCLKALYLESVLIDFVIQFGFTLLKIVDKGKNVKIFSFQKK